MTDTRGNALLVGKLLSLSALVLLAFGGIAWAGWLPYRPATARALAVTLALFGIADLAVAFYFMVRYR
jgi:ABC-type Na+ efflux pump permease subunit